MSRFRTLSIAALVILTGLGWLYWPEIRPVVAQNPGLSTLVGPPAETQRPSGPRAVPVVTGTVERRPCRRRWTRSARCRRSPRSPSGRASTARSPPSTSRRAPRSRPAICCSPSTTARCQAQLAQVDAQTAKDEAQLAQAKRDLARAEDLLARKINTQVQRDIAATLTRVNEAQLAADKAQQPDPSQTQLSYTRIAAPVSGRIGSITAKVGTVVRTADSGVIATVNQFDPIYIAFSIPQAALGPLHEAMAKGPVSVEARIPGRPIRGTVTFIENTVDAVTGTVQVKASMPNAEEVLWPGAFVQVQLLLGEQADAVVVPSAAVQIGQDGPFVFVIKDNKAQLKRVKVERIQGNLTVVASGVDPGEDVVTDGQLRLVNGAPVSRDAARAKGAAPALANGS